MRMTVAIPFFRSRVLIFVAVSMVPLYAQTPVPAGEAISTISVSARLVVVPAVVRDKQGGLIGDLTKDDFLLKVDGKPQALRYFDHDADAPLTLGLLIDTSMSQLTILDDERAASIAFLEKMLAPSDKAFILSFDIAVRRLADVTASRPTLDEGLRALAGPRPDFHPSPGSDRAEKVEAYRKAIRNVIGTKLFDAVDYASSRISAKQEGRRALILLTDGGDYGSRRTLEDAVDAAQRADTIVYAIDYAAAPGASRSELIADFRNARTGGSGADGGVVLVPASSGDSSGQRRPGMDRKKVLERLCSETGGKVFEVSGKQTVADIYAKIAEELRAQYRLGFSPAGENAAEGYHRVQLTLTGAAGKGKHAIQTRDGYFYGAPQVR